MSQLSSTDTWRFYSLAPSLLGAPADAPTTGETVADRIHIEQIPIAESNAVCTEYHYLHRARTGAQLAYGVWYRGIGVGVIHWAYPRWTKSPYPEAPNPANAVECARVYIANLDRHGYPVGNAKGRRIEGLSVAAFQLASERIKADWETKYPDLPAVTVAVSWSDNSRHPGRLYQLAGWRLDAANVAGRPHSGKWTHTNVMHKGNKNSHFHDDYRNVKSRWSVVLDGSLVRERAEAL